MKSSLMLVGVVALVVLTGCKPVGSEDLRISCLDGVEYWYGRAGYHAMLAPKFNIDGTLNACKERG